MIHYLLVAVLDQPQVQSALITGAVGLLVFAATQWVLHRRGESDLLREKLEELYRSLNRLSDLQAARMKAFKDGVEHDRLKELQGTEHTENIAMLCSFYFPKLEKMLADVMSANNAVFSGLSSESRATGSEELVNLLIKLNLEISKTTTYISQNSKILFEGRWVNLLPSFMIKRLF